MATAPSREEPKDTSYVLADQVGFLLRQAMQRHVALFTQIMGEDLTPTQWAVLSYLFHNGGCSQNLLGRQTAMDVATIKGVVDRLSKRALVATSPDPTDGRRVIVDLTAQGRATAQKLMPKAKAVTQATLEPIGVSERATLIDCLKLIR